MVERPRMNDAPTPQLRERLVQRGIVLLQKHRLIEQLNELSYRSNDQYRRLIDFEEIAVAVALLEVEANKHEH